MLGGGSTSCNKEDVRRTLSNSASNPDTASSSVSDLSKFSPVASTPSTGNKFSLSLRSGASKLFRNKSAVASKFVGQGKKHSSVCNRANTLNLCSDTSYRKSSAGSLDITLTKSSEWPASSPGSESQQINMSVSTGSVCHLNQRESPGCSSGKPVSFTIEGESIHNRSEQQLLGSCSQCPLTAHASGSAAATTTTSTKLPLTQISSVSSTSTNSFSIYQWSSTSGHVSLAEEDSNMIHHSDQLAQSSSTRFRDTAFPEIFSDDAAIIRGSSFSIPETLYTQSSSQPHQSQVASSQSSSSSKNNGNGSSHILLHTADSFTEDSAAT